MSSISREAPTAAVSAHLMRGVHPRMYAAPLVDEDEPQLAGCSLGKKSQLQAAEMLSTFVYASLWAEVTTKVVPTYKHSP
jgi:hypothetical protein